MGQDSLTNLKTETKPSKSMASRSGDQAICLETDTDVVDSSLRANESSLADIIQEESCVKDGSCITCRNLEFRNKELKKEQLLLQTKLSKHKRLSHNQLPLCEGLGDQLPKEQEEKVKTPKEPEVEEKKSSASFTPMPRVKRLKGKLAQSVGRRIDGSDWTMIQPELKAYEHKPL